MVYGLKITCYSLEILVFNWENNYNSIKLNTNEFKKIDKEKKFLAQCRKRYGICQNSKQNKKLI